MTRHGLPSQASSNSGYSRSISCHQALHANTQQARGSSANFSVPHRGGSIAMSPVKSTWSPAGAPAIPRWKQTKRSSPFPG